MRTLIFCTSYASSPAIWHRRYRTWVDAISSGGLSWAQILIVDDGSVELPDWPDLCIVNEGDPIPPQQPLVLYHFGTRLGRISDYDFPGWFRSFAFAGRYGVEAGFEKVIHIESDAFLISSRASDYVNHLYNGWTVFWCPRHKFAECGIQVIAGPELGELAKFCNRQNAEFIHDNIERQIPFTFVEHNINGDRYHESLSYIPHDADFSTQTALLSRPKQLHLWWLAGHGLNSSQELAALYLHQDYGDKPMRHVGVNYLLFLRECNRSLKPRNYFEIGTKEGSSVSQFDCDAVCVDPDFLIGVDVLHARKRGFFFQQTSDSFFLENDLRALLKSDLDFAFLDGLHLYEYLLRDFVNVERFCHQRSIVVLHDCLPSNERMAERTLRRDEDESEETRDYWTGDVWKLLLVLAKYRKDLKIYYVDCPPTGIVLVTNLSTKESNLRLNYDRIVEEFRDVQLSEFGLAQLWRLFPTLNSNALLQQPLDFATLFSPY